MSRTLREYMEAVGATGLLTPDQEQALARRARAGDRAAFRDLVEANLRFVVREVKRFRRPGVNFLDLIAEGNLGLLRAARDFDPDRGLRFVTYAAWWIREAVASFLARQGGAVALPTKKARLAHRAQQEGERLGRRLGRVPEAGEVAASLKVDADELRRVALAARHHVPLEAAPAAAAADGLEERETALHRRSLGSRLVGLMGRLPARERQCVRLYFGLDGGRARHFGEIGPLLGLGREGARLVFHRAMESLRAMPELARLDREWRA